MRIFKTIEAAINDAKLDALHRFSKNWHGSPINLDTLINEYPRWLINEMTGRCYCNLKKAITIEAVFYPDLLNINELFIGKAGVCKLCGIF